MRRAAASIDRGDWVAPARKIYLAEVMRSCADFIDRGAGDQLNRVLVRARTMVLVAEAGSNGDVSLKLLE